MSTLPHTQHLVSQMFNALSHTASQTMSRVMWLSLEATSDPMTQAFLHRSSRLNLLLIYANFYLIQDESFCFEQLTLTQDISLGTYRHTFVPVEMI